LVFNGYPACFINIIIEAVNISREISAVMVPALWIVLYNADVEAVIDRKAPDIKTNAIPNSPVKYMILVILMNPGLLNILLRIIRNNIFHDLYP
jgi:hypothetical protein